MCHYTARLISKHFSFFSLSTAEDPFASFCCEFVGGDGRRGRRGG